MFEYIKATYALGKDLGRKHGVRKGVRVYMDQSGFTGALGIVTALGVVLIGMYVIAIVVGSMGSSITSNGIINTSSAWGTILSNVDTNARSSFQIANILPIAITRQVRGSFEKIKKILCLSSYHKSYVFSRGMSRRGCHVDRYRCIQLPVI